MRLDASRQETESGRLEAILEAVNFTAVQLLKAPRWQDALDEVLAKLGQATGVRRVYLHLVQLDGAGELIATNEAEWVASGVELIFDLPSYSPYRHGGGAEMRRTLDAGEVWIGGRDDLPLAISEAHPDNAPETALIAPVIVAGERRGALGFNHLDERRWSGAEVAALQTAAEIIGAAISRDRAENQSQSSGQLFRSMFESTAVGIVLVEFETLRPLQVNAAFCAMVGRSESELKRMTMVELTHPDDRETTVALHSQQLAGEDNATRIEKRYLRPDGSYVWADVVIAPVMKNMAGPHQKVTIAVDITRRRQSEEALAERESWLRALVDASPLAVVGVDPQGNVTTWSKAAEELFGWTAEEVVGGEPKHVPAEDMTAYERVVRKVLSGGVATGKEIKRQRKDGSLIDVSVSAGPTRDGEGRITGAISIFEDIRERKAAEEALAERESRLQALVDASPLAVVGLDTQGNVTTWSKSAEQMFGWRAEQVLGLKTPFVPARANAVQDLTLRKLLSGEVVTNLNLERERSDGSLIEVSLSAGPVRDFDGKIVGTIGVYEDIRERKAAQRALAERESRLQALVDASPLAVVGLDTQGNVTNWSKSAEQIFGWSAEQVEGRKSPLVPAQEMADYKRTLRGVLAGGVVNNLEIVRKRSDGSPIEVSLSGGPVRDGDGQVIGTIGVYEDIQARKAAAEAERRATAILEAVSYAAAKLLREPNWEDVIDEVIARLGEAAVAGRSFLHLARRNGDEVIATLQAQWTAPDVPSAGSSEPFRPFTGELGERLRRTLDSGHSFFGTPEELPDGILEAYSATGTRAVLLTPVMVGNERVGSIGLTCTYERSWSKPEIEALEAAAGILGAAFARSRMEEALWHSEERFLQAQKMEAIGQLAGGIAHDFNNLLTVISGHAYSFPSFALSPEAQLAASEILAASQRAAALTQQLLVFSRGQVLHPENVEATAIVVGVVQMLRRVIGENIAIEVEREERPTPVYVEPAQLEQIVLNLIVNARDAMPRGGTLTIRVGRESASESPVELAGDEQVVISIADTGLGMSAETKARIFEPFFTTKEPGAGTGLGLSTVYGIVRQSGGAIEVESSPGEGTTFSVYLPLGSAPVEPVNTVTVEEEPSSPGTVLVVEDDSAVRELAATMLARAGHEVRVVENGVLALESLARQDGADVVLTDVVMPAMSGWELGDAIRLRYPEIRVLYMSGYPRRELDLPITADLIQKPFSAVELCERVAEAIAEARRKAR